MKYLKSSHSLLDQARRILSQQPDPEFLRHAEFRRYPDYYGVPPDAEIPVKKTWWKKFLTRLMNLLTLLFIVVSILLNVYFLLMKPLLGAPQKDHEPTLRQETARADSLDREIGYLQIINADLETTAKERQQRILEQELKIRQLKSVNQPAKMVSSGKVVGVSSGRLRKVDAGSGNNAQQIATLSPRKTQQAGPDHSGKKPKVTAVPISVRPR